MIQLKKRKRALKGSDDENDKDYSEKKEKRIKEKRKEKKIRKGEEMYKEFSQFSSGSDGEGIEDESELEVLSISFKYLSRYLFSVCLTLFSLHLLDFNNNLYIS